MIKLPSTHVERRGSFLFGICSCQWSIPIRIPSIRSSDGTYTDENLATAYSLVNAEVEDHFNFHLKEYFRASVHLPDRTLGSDTTTRSDIPTVRVQRRRRIIRYVNSEDRLPEEGDTGLLRISLGRTTTEGTLTDGGVLHLNAYGATTGGQF